MTTVDDKVVAMSFESSKFEKGVNNTLSALDKLKQALHFPNAGKGLDDVNAAGKRVDLSHIGRTVDDIKGRLGAFRATALLVFADVASTAVRAGARFAKAFTLQPLISGFQEYSTNLNAVQTILANTEASGATLNDVNAALLDLNKYSDQTIYNFSQMARNIGTFTAAGVDLKTSTASIKGIANLAALSGSNAEQASTAMYQLSQAISAGRVGLQDWNSVVNAGMGGTVFQRALAQTAEAMGTIKKGAVELKGPMKNVAINGASFRESIQAKPGQKSWLTSDVLTTTLKQFTGDLNDAELAAIGFSQEQIKAIQQTAKTAKHAATEVKTIAQVLDVAKETAGSGWAQTWQIIFGNFGEAKTTFTALSNAINGVINANSAARNKLLQDWKDLGGRTVLIDSIRIAFHNLGEILAPIKDAFRDIFPATTGRDLFNLTKRFHNFAEALKPSETTIANLRRTFRGLFALLDIGKQVVQGIFTVFGRLFNVMGTGDGGFLNFTGNIGDMLVALDKALKKGDAFQHFFERLGDILAVPVRVLKAAAGAIADLFGGFSPGGVSDQMSGFSKVMGPLSGVLNAVADAWDRLTASFGGGQGLDWQKNLEAIMNFVVKIPQAIGEAFSHINFDAILAVIRTGLLGAIVIMLKNFLGKGSLLEQISKSGGGILGNISGSFKALQGSMQAMQTNIKAKTLKEIAIAIALLTASVVALSFVNPERLKSSLAAMAVGFGELLASMAILEKISTNTGFIKMPFIAGSMILLATAIDILAIAVYAFSRLSWEELAKGLGGVGVALNIITLAMRPMSANAGGMVRASIGILAIATSMKILASAVKDFAAMNLKQLAKGLGAMAIGLDAIVISMNRLPARGAMVRAGLGVIAIAAAMKILAEAVADFAEMSVVKLAKGLGAVAVGLAAIVQAMRLMPKTMAFQAAGLVLVSIALQGIAKAVERMGGMSMKQIARGIVAMAISLDVLAAAMYAMKGSVGGSLALAAAASSIALLAPGLVLLGRMSWRQIVTGLAALAGSLTVLGVAGALISTAVPALLGLGAALVLVGGALALAGAGIFLISTGLSALAVSGPAGIGILVAAMKELVRAIPDMAQDLVLGLLEVVKGISKTAPEFVRAIAKILEMILDAIVKVAPKVEKAFDVLLQSGLDILRRDGPKVIKAGLQLVLDLLKGIRDNIGKIVTVAADIVINLINALANKAGDIVRAGVNLIVQLLRGIANGIKDVVIAAGNIVVKFLEGIGTNLKNVVLAGASVIVKFIEGLSKSVNLIIQAGTDAIVNFLKGVGRAGPRIVTAATTMIIKFIATLSKNAVRLADAGATAVINFLNGVADVIEKREPEIIKAGFRIGKALVTGMINGLAHEAKNLKDAAIDTAKSLIGTFHKHFKVRSPSQVFYDIGRNIVLGLSLGMLDNRGIVVKSAEGMSNQLIWTVDKVLSSKTKEMEDLGRFVASGFIKGVRGSTDDAKDAFSDMNDKLTTAMTTLQNRAKTEQEKLDKLMGAIHSDPKAIGKQLMLTASIVDMLGRARSAHEQWVASLKDERGELLRLSREYERIGDRIVKAKDVLADAKKTREDSIKSFSDQFSTLPSIVTEDAEGNAVDQLATYMDALRNQANAVAAYQSTLQQLRKLGLDDATYQKLLAEGTADQQFANQILAGGKTAVQSLNTLDTQLMKVSKTLATNAANNLYQAGIDAAQGLVDGLEKKKGDIRRQMESIAREMVAALKTELKMKSPSKEFEDIGKLSMVGLAQGFANSTKVVTDAVESAATTALGAMRDTIRGMSGVISDELNPNPVITPVLDLSEVQKQANDLSGIGRSMFVPFGSLNQASIISSRQAQAQEAAATTSTDAPTIKFEQNNYSPEALSEIEIFRQTKNGLSRLRDTLATS